MWCCHQSALTRLARSRRNPGRPTLTASGVTAGHGTHKLNTLGQSLKTQHSKGLRDPQCQSHHKSSGIKALCSLHGADLNHYVLTSHKCLTNKFPYTESENSHSTEVNLIITLLLEVDVVLFPKPGVGEVAWICLCLAGKECILGYVYSDIFWWWNDVWRPWKKQKKVLKALKQAVFFSIRLMNVNSKFPSFYSFGFHLHFSFSSC